MNTSYGLDKERREVTMNGEWGAKAQALRTPKLHIPKDFFARLEKNGLLGVSFLFVTFLLHPLGGGDNEVFFLFTCTHTRRIDCILTCLFFTYCALVRFYS